MGKGGTIFAVVIFVTIAAYFFAPMDLLDYLPLDSNEITTKINAVVQKNWRLDIEPISDLSNFTAEIIENRTGFTFDISKKEKQIEQEVHHLVNIEREKFGLDSLVYDSNLASVAKLHSFDMSERDFFAHENLDGKNPTDRGADLDYHCIKINAIYVTSGIGENIFMINSRGGRLLYSIDEIAQRAVEGWMNSEGHRENILEKNYGSEGIGVIITDKSIHVTQNFC